MLTTPEEWTPLLADWSTAVRAAHPDLPPSLSFPAATPADLADAEASLGLAVPLPPSYRAFLCASNGWLFISSAVPVLRPLGRLSWFKKQHRDWIAAYTTAAGPLPPDEAYFSYSAEMCREYNPKHLRDALQISDVGDAAALLLNPMVIHTDGEWEAWFVADWLPGVRRYRSFAAMMFSQYRELKGGPISRPPAAPTASDQLPTVYRDPPTLTSRRVAPRKPARPVSQLLRTAQDHSWNVTMGTRIKAIQELAARRESSAIPTLRTLLRDPLPDVRAQAMIALGTFRAADAVPDLIARVVDQDEECACAIAALGQIGTAPAIDFLAAYARSGALNATAAAIALSSRRTARSDDGPDTP